MRHIPSLGAYRSRISGDNEAVYDYDNGIRYTYDDMDRRSDRLASFLTNILGLKKGDRIAFCSGNSIAFLDAYYASCKTGVIITTYNCLLGFHELKKLTEKETPKVFFYSKRFQETVDQLKKSKGIQDFISLDGSRGEGEHYRYADIMNYDYVHLPSYPPLNWDDAQMLIHTGGTTGTPKAAVISSRALFFNAVGAVLSFGLSCRDCTYVMLPFFHTAAWNVLTLPILHAGGRVVITSGFHADIALKIIAEERPTVMMGVETVYKKISDHPDFDRTDLSCLRFMISGAAPIAPRVMEQYWTRGVKLVNAYGMTEIGPNNIAMPMNQLTLEELRARGGSVGKPLFFNEVRIVDENDEDVLDGEPGELIWRGNLTFSGYWMDEESTRQIIRDGWIYSGDIAYRDDEGYYYICGRKKNMFITGGENIYPIEIEHALMTNPDVEDACVIGVRDEKWGEVGKALIVKKPGSPMMAEDIRNYAARHIGSIKVPKYVQFIDEIPKNSVGKLDLQVIHARYGTPAKAFVSVMK